MLRPAADEDFNHRILRGLLRRRPELDLVRVRDAGLMGRAMRRYWIPSAPISG